MKKTLNVRALLLTALIWFLAILGSVLITCLAFGDLDVRASYKLGEPIIVKMNIEGMPEKAELRKDKFKVPGANPVKVNENTWHIWAVPGEYKIEAVGEWRLYQEIEAKDGKIYKVIADEDDYEFSATFVVVEGDDIVPPPPPPPTPGSRWAVIWEETEDRTPQQGNLFLRLRKEFQNGRLQVHDVTSLPAPLRALESQRPQSLQLPALMVVVRQPDGTDKVVRTVELPSDVAGVIKEISR